MVRLAEVPLTSTSGPHRDALQAPKSLADTGLPGRFATDLLLRHLARAGEMRTGELANRLGVALSVIEPTLDFLRAEKLAEVPRRGTFDADVAYALSDAGRIRAREALEKCQYVGPFPVTLADYTERVESQSARHQPVLEARIRQALGTAVVPDSLIQSLGAAVNSGKSLYIYGPSGSGKTYVAQRLVNVLHGTVWVPHAVYVDGEIIQIFDPLVHQPLAQPGATGALERHAGGDGRWVRTRRPVVILGGELTLAMLDMEFEKVSRFYVAPPQLKANNGMLIIDDLGRQRVSARELMNRWIVPLDRGVDYMALHTSTKFQVPFDVGVVFCSNLSPGQLGDPAFARRLGYKLKIGSMDEAGYREVFRQACDRSGIAYRDDAADFLIHELHRADAMPLYPTIPLDVVSKLRDRATFLGIEPGLTQDGLRWAWSLYFAPDDDQIGVPSLDDSR